MMRFSCKVKLRQWQNTLKRLELDLLQFPAKEEKLAPKIEEAKTMIKRYKERIDKGEDLGVRLV